MSKHDLSFIFCYVDTEEAWTVDSDGRPQDHIEDTDYMSDPTKYACNQCGEHFDTFEEALSHSAKEVKQLVKEGKY
jgi:hypothetical protein